MLHAGVKDGDMRQLNPSKQIGQDDQIAIQ